MPFVLCGDLQIKRRNFTPLIKKCWAPKPPLFWDSTLCTIPDEGRPHLHCGRSLISCHVQLYFECNTGNHGKSWVHPICLLTCIKLLNGWKNGWHHMPITVPMVCTRRRGHSSDCYFCLTEIPGITFPLKHKVIYLNLPSAMIPVPQWRAACTDTTI